MTNERHIRLGRGFLKTMREKHNDQWIDIKQTIEDPRISELFRDITREEIDDALMRVDRMNSPDLLKNETKLHDETFAEYTTPRSGYCKRKKLDDTKRPSGKQENQDNETPTHQAGEEKPKETP